MIPEKLVDGHFERRYSEHIECPHCNALFDRFYRIGAYEAQGSRSETAHCCPRCHRPIYCTTSRTDPGDYFPVTDDEFDNLRRSYEWMASRDIGGGPQ